MGADRVVAVHIDNGFMRLNESSQVALALQALGVAVHVVDATDTFFRGKTTVTNASGDKVITKDLQSTTSPEEKRKIIGDTFMRY